ncbi:hypothetical protein [Sphingomonas sp. GC_Shp_1]|nr:hypothetical protein [Sphingomonas sp. GC_Shp_1]
MGESFTVTHRVNDPIAVVNDMALSLDRVTSMLATTNNDYMEHVVGHLNDQRSSIHRIAYNVWCINQIAVEKLQEITKLLDEAEGQLLSLRPKTEDRQHG